MMRYSAKINELSALYDEWTINCLDKITSGRKKSK